MSVDVDAARARTEAFLALARELVALESPSDEPERVREAAERFAGGLEERGAAVELVTAPGSGPHLRARIPPAGRSGAEAPLLVVGHLDTVHPVGTLERLPFEVDGDVVRGPGVYDMKGNWAAALVALDLLREAGDGPGRELLVLATGDEEVGSGTSRSLIEACARKAGACVVLEPSAPGGAVKTARKGVALYRIDVRGVPAHAGIEPEKGASAIHELARHIAGVVGLGDPERGTTVNVGTLEGGTATNVVAEEARAEVDVRFWTADEGRRVEEALLGLEAVDGRCAVEVEGGVNRPPLERTPESSALYARAREIAGALGFDLPEGESGGASDGNFIAGAGCPTVDGLGIQGGGAHSMDEHIRLDDVPRRIALYARLFREL